MPYPSLLIVFAVCAALLAAGVMVVMLVSQRRRRERADFDLARQQFRRQREHLEADFFMQASQAGKPRGLGWKECEFASEVLFARDKKTGAVWALVPVTVSFEAVEGGGMEHVEAVGNLRAATALFRWQHRAWTTEGRVLFNLEPKEAIRRFQHELQWDEAETAPRQ